MINNYTTYFIHTHLDNMRAIIRNLKAVHKGVVAYKVLVTEHKQVDFMDMSCYGCG